MPGQESTLPRVRKTGASSINTNRSFEALGLGDFVRDFRPERLCTVPATELALKHVGRAVPNVPLLGGFAAISGVISLGAVISAIRDRFPGKVADGNVAAATGAFEAVVQQTQEPAHA